MMTLDQYARDHLNPAMQELDPVGYREMDVDSAVRTALGRYVVSPLPRAKLPAWFAMGRLPFLREEILSAWREQHA